MAEKEEKQYGRQVPAQPGGDNYNPPAGRGACSGSPRLGPAKPGGNPARKLNPYSNKK